MSVTAVTEARFAGCDFKGGIGREGSISFASNTAQYIEAVRADEFDAAIGQIAVGAPQQCKSQALLLTPAHNPQNIQGQSANWSSIFQAAGRVGDEGHPAMVAVGERLGVWSLKS
jgi:hypothetical protein